MCDMVNWPTFIENNLCSCTSSSFWTIFPTRIRKIHQVILGWKDCPDTGRSTGAYIIFYQDGPIYHGTHGTGPVAQDSAESGYNAACTAGMALAHFRMLINEFLNKDPDIVP